jgi:predicted nucleic acid-binding protein
LDTPPRSRTVAVDANVLINLAHIRRLDLLARLSGYDFIAPEDVVAEVCRENGRRELEVALASESVRVESIVELEDLVRYAELRQSLGRGESACLVLAERHGWLIASDEKRRFRREALSRLGPGRLVTTPGLMILAIRAGLLTIEEADQDKQTLESHRFRMSFRSFREVVALAGP